MAYRIKPEQVEGPGWMPDVHLDLRANLPSGANKEQIPDMLQALLADRLGLKAHLQSVDKPVYALVAASGGAKLKPAEAPDPISDGRDRIDHGIVYGSGDFGPFRVTIADGAFHYDFSRMTMSNLAGFLSQNKQQVVLNETDIEGSFQIHIDVPQGTNMDLISMIDRDEAKAASDPSGNLLVASIEKLGLKLVRRRAPVTKLVVDQVNKVPTAN